MPEPYNLAEVARELSLHPQTVKYHIYTTNGYFAGKGKAIGKALASTQKELDKMREIARTMPPSGRRVTKIKTTDDRQAKALELKEQGLTLSQIAKELGYANRSGASRAVKAAKRKAKKAR